MENRNQGSLTEMLKGVLEGCVLELISRGETYGYEITRRLNALGFTEVTHFDNFFKKHVQLSPLKFRNI